MEGSTAGSLSTLNSPARAAACFCAFFRSFLLSLRSGIDSRMFVSLLASSRIAVCVTESCSLAASAVSVAGVVTVVSCSGRSSGWIAASSTLGCSSTTGAKETRASVVRGTTPSVAVIMLSDSAAGRASVVGVMASVFLLFLLFFFFEIVGDAGSSA